MSPARGPRSLHFLQRLQARRKAFSATRRSRPRAFTRNHAQNHAPSETTPWHTPCKGPVTRAPMPVHGIHYVKTHFSELVRLVERGETITITRGYAPVALLVRIGATPQARRQGTLHTTLKLDPALWD